MTFTLTIPDELFIAAARIAESEHSSVEDVISSALADQLAERERLNQRAARGRRETFLAVLRSAPDVEPEEHDRRK